MNEYGVCMINRDLSIVTNSKIIINEIFLSIKGLKKTAQRVWKIAKSYLECFINMTFFEKPSSVYFSYTTIIGV